MIRRRALVSPPAPAQRPARLMASIRSGVLPGLALLALTTASAAQTTPQTPLPPQAPVAIPAAPQGAPADVAAAKALPLRPADQAGLPSSAQTPPSGAIDITSDDPMEWHEDQMVAIARGNVLAIRGDDTLRCDTLVAYFRKTPKGDTEFFRMAADGRVILASPSSQAFGDHAVYDTDQHVTVMTGKDLHMVTRSDTIYAKDTLEYWEDQKLVVGRGDAIALNQKGDRLRGDVLVGVLEENTAKQLEMVRVDAKGNVVVVTPKDVGVGEQGTYNVRTRVAILTGNVRLTQGQNQVNGQRAEMNFATQVSRMLPNSGAPNASGGRVHSILVPKQKSDPAPAGTPNPTPTPGGK